MLSLSPSLETTTGCATASNTYHALSGGGGVVAAVVAAGAVNHARDEKKWKLSGSMGTVGGKCRGCGIQSVGRAMPATGRKMKEKEGRKEGRDRGGGGGGGGRESGNLAKR